MSATIKGLTVTIEEDIREDHAKKIKEAIRMIKGVISVELVEEDMDHHMAKAQVRHEFEEKIWKALK